MIEYNYHIWIIVKMLKWKFPLLFGRSLDLHTVIKIK